MGITDIRTWLEGEVNCFNWLTAGLGDTEGVQGFRGGLPEHAYDVWYFEVSGGGGTLLDADINNDTPGGCGFWNFGARVKGRFSERDDALLLGGWLRTKLPTKENPFKYVRTFRPVGLPSVTPVSITLRDGDTWDGHEFEWEMEVVLKKA